MNMKSAIPLTPGTPFEGGFYAGTFCVGDTTYALIVAPKSDGEIKETPWNTSDASVAGALSYCEGLENTSAMANAGSSLAARVRGLRIGGFDDWYLPSQDELEILYRNMKPTADRNYCYARSGINLSAVPPTRPYTHENPVQTASEAFQEGGAEAFETEWYWSSTQHAAYSLNAWCQLFGDGNQSNFLKDYELRARAVRRLAI